MKKIFLIEDHDKALTHWRRLGFKNLDLIHVDAHMDYAVPPAQPAEAVLKEAASIQELKERLEYTLAFQRYQKDLTRQTDIGNYIHRAMEEGIVRHLTWVIPGTIKDFPKYTAAIKDALRTAARAKNRKARLAFAFLEAGAMTTMLQDRVFHVCVLEALPKIRLPVLLDIDADFLVIANILEAGHTQKIGLRKPWIGAQELAAWLSSKISGPACITVAYSTQGGWTPMRFRYLADEVAHHLAPGRVKKRCQQRQKASFYFNRFIKNGLKKDYVQALQGDMSYRSWDNNYGPLYLDKGKFSRAKKEFRRILKVDSWHAGALWGMGVLAQRKKKYAAAQRWFQAAWQSAEKYRIFRSSKNLILFALAQGDFRLKNFECAQKELKVCCQRSPLDPRPRYLLGRLAHAKRSYEKAGVYYRQAIQLGFSDEKPIMGLIKIVKNFEQKSDIIKYIRRKYAAFRQNFLSLQRRHKKKPVRELARMEKVLNRLKGKLKQMGEANQ